ncbi:hypothetical protein K0U00_23090, partial [Paenibacillus sepulcri]|nr:hypothetical protein [Paenibacillus sepulcri]
LTGAFSISAKLESVNADNPAKGMAGVMIRQGTGVDDVYAALFVRNGQLIAQYRKGGPWSEEVLNKAVTGPIWLKVERQSALNLIRTYTSSDGINWTLNVTTKSGETQDTTANFWAWHEAGTELNAGVFVSAAEAGKSVSAVFSNIKDTASWPNTP